MSSGSARPARPSHAARARVTRHRFALAPRSRVIGEMCYLALAMVAVTGLALAVLTNCDFAASYFTLKLLLLTVFYCLLGLLFFAVAIIGNDACASMLHIALSFDPEGFWHGAQSVLCHLIMRRRARRCQNAEALMTTLVPPLLGGSLGPEAAAIADYYLFDAGGNFTSVVKTALGVDIDSMLASFNATRDSEIAVRSSALLRSTPTRACI